MSHKPLSNEQQKLYNHLASGKNVFMTGPGGAGKSHVLRLFINRYKRVRKISVTSTTGSSALLIEGTTLHSFLGIGIGNTCAEDLVKDISAQQWLVNRWVNTECLIIDEISMLSPELFDKIELMARMIRNNENPFGGMQIVLSGDFLQLPCIGTTKFCFEAESWKKCIDVTVYMQGIFRQKDISFQTVLNCVRIGNITDEVKEILNSRVNIQITNNFGIKPTKIFSLNRDVDEINERELDILSEDGRIFREYECIIRNHSGKLHVLDKFLKYCPAIRKLQLCVGAQVMLIKNIDIKFGLANGSRGIVESFSNNDGILFPVVRFINGELRKITYTTWEHKENGKTIVEISQLPLKIAYAISVHKCQGSSMDYTEIDLSNIFEYGQAYVALSRVKNLEGLSISAINYDLIKANPKALEYYQSLSV